MKLFGSKKGVSPLIATVLLIAFAVALGAVVMSWGKGYVTDLQDSAKDSSDSSMICTSDVNPSIVQVDRIDQICLNRTDPSSTENTVYAIVQNSPRRDVERFEARVIGLDSKVPVTIDLANESSLDNGASRLMTIVYNNSIGDPALVALTPVILYGGDEIRCNDNDLSAIDIRTCDEIWYDD